MHHTYVIMFELFCDYVQSFTCVLTSDLTVQTYHIRTGLNLQSDTSDLMGICVALK